VSRARLHRRSPCKAVTSCHSRRMYYFLGKILRCMLYRAVAATALWWVQCRDPLLVWCQTSELSQGVSRYRIGVVRTARMRSADMRCSYFVESLTLRDVHEDWVLPGNRALHCPCVRAAPVKLLLVWMQRATSSKQQRFDGENIP
jgi:hypothetical protein